MIKAIPAHFTLGELMTHLREEESPEGFFTLVEWAEHFGRPRESMRQLLVEAKAQGVLQVTRMRRERIDGIMTMVSGYRFDVGDD